MLSPFPGYVPTGQGPLSSAGAATFSRRIRDDAGRYQPGPVLEQAVSLGHLHEPSEPTLFRYEIDQPGCEPIVGLIGVTRAVDLIPHEGTVFGITDHPAPVVEIRPILALVDGPLPNASAVGPSVQAVEASGTSHTLVAVEHGGFDLDRPVVADGHHRRRAVMVTRGSDATILTLVVGNSGAGLEAGTFHRLFAEAERLPASAGEVFEIEPLPVTAVVEGALVWVEGESGRAFTLRARPEAASKVPEALRGSPAAIARALLYPLLGVDEDKAVHVASWELAVEGLARSGGALLLPDVDIGAVLAAARGGLLLPPKASRFRPKPLRGLVLRVAD
jgi:hypothetical protein